MDAFLLTLAVVFVAELGDKSQLMAVAAAARHPAPVVLAGIAAAAVAVHGLSVLAGRVLAEALSGPAATAVAGVAFLGFAVWTLRGDDHDAAADPAGRRSGLAAAAAVAATFFASEIGDKTMLATAALAARQGAVPTWAGATAGMVAADALAIAVGRQLAARLSARTMRLASAAVFAAFGLALVLQAVL
jgi:Ca2+/H+ antiporter, TMEM165/GDT1 family